MLDDMSGAGGRGGTRMRVKAWTVVQGDSRALGLAAFSSAALASVVYVLWVGRGQTLILDEWSYLTSSMGWSATAFLTPHNGHLVLLPILLLKLMYPTFGLAPHAPYQALAVLLNVLIATLVYVFARRRLGPLMALVPGVLILFYGAGWDAFVTAYQLPNLLGMATGIAAVIGMERRDLRGDILACLFLSLSLASFSVGIAFAAGIAVALLLRGRDDAIRRAWVVMVPAIPYAGWFVWASKFHQADVTAYNVGALFSGMADQLAAALAGITGLFTTPGATELSTMISVRSSWGMPLVVAVAIGSALMLTRQRPTASLGMVLTILVVYLVMISLTLGGGRVPDAGRYVYLGSVLTLLVLAEIASGVVVGRTWGVAVATLCFFSLLANGAVLGAGGRLVRLEAATNRAELGALEIARDRVAGDLMVEPTDQQPAMSNPDMLFDASTYFEFAKSFGTPAYSEAEIEGSPEQARGAADLLFARALPISVRPGFRPTSSGAVGVGEAGGFAAVQRRGRCVTVTPRRGFEGRMVVGVPRGGMTYKVHGRQRPSVRLRRFAQAFDVAPALPTGSAQLLVPTDRSMHRWEAAVATATELELCP
jgi:hypothetical protein